MLKSCRPLIATSLGNARDSYMKCCRLATADTTNKFLRFSILSPAVDLWFSWTVAGECCAANASKVSSLALPVTHNDRHFNSIQTREEY